ncbi:hypothetical protein DAETH_07260 [Deinococcus aetherius]|uniref:Uncharacterized protein n=1 Tax=Deinococcus aetherius TaxID=200252 RepID=A0ABN6RBM1_9DEIO|nr:hypothetical protein DAETH_07260 [Deinococcus aetherius]
MLPGECFGDGSTFRFFALVRDGTAQDALKGRGTRFTDDPGMKAVLRRLDDKLITLLQPQGGSNLLRNGNSSLTG